MYFLFSNKFVIKCIDFKKNIIFKVVQRCDHNHKIVLLKYVNNNHSYHFL